MDIDPKILWIKAARRALSSTGNVASGAVMMAASVALANPLPAILWGVGSAAWVLFASTSEKYTRQLVEEQRQAAEAKAEMDREVLRAKVATNLGQEPFAGWIRAGLLPDYLRVFSRLVEVRERVGKLLVQKAEEYMAGLGIQKQLTYLLTTYLQFVQARITYLQVLADVRVGVGLDAVLPPSPNGPQTPAAPAPPVRPVGPLTPPEPARGRTFTRRESPHPMPPPLPAAPVAPFPSLETRLAVLDSRIAALKDLAAREPATARTREWHIGILTKQEELLKECQTRDQQVVAELTAVPDIFDVISGRVSASQFSVSEVASYMGGVVEQIEETQKFVDSMRPIMDEMLGPAGLPGVGASPLGAS